jgi:hypothetical protein
MSRVRATQRSGTLIAFMPELATNLFLLEDASRTRKLADTDLDALRRVAEFTNTFVARPNKDLGRPGPVFGGGRPRRGVPESLSRCSTS